MNKRSIYEQSSWAKTFLIDVKRQAIGHAYLLYGYDELMLECTANGMVEDILCSNCLDRDLVKKKLEHGTHPDVIKVKQENKSKIITVDQIEDIVAKVLYAPMENKYKVVVVDHFECANMMAQNKFLKTLEEPPQGVVFILCAVGLKGILTTIKSRCQMVSIAKCDQNSIREYLSSQFGQKQGLEDVVLASEGNLSLAIKLYQDDDFERMKAICFDIVTKMQNSSEVLFYSAQLLKFKDRVMESFSILEQIFSDIAKYQNDLPNLMIYSSQIQRYKETNVKYSTSAVVEIIKRIGKARKKIKANCQPQGVIDWLLLSILEVRYQCK